jgi:hypothetical protein
VRAGAGWVTPGVGWVAENAEYPRYALAALGLGFPFVELVVGPGYSFDVCPACGRTASWRPLRVIGSRVTCQCRRAGVLIAACGFPLHVADKDAPWTS